MKFVAIIGAFLLQTALSQTVTQSTLTTGCVSQNVPPKMACKGDGKEHKCHHG